MRPTDDGPARPFSIGEETAARRDRGKFVKGGRAGPGRRRGVRNVATVLLERIDAADIEAVLNAVVTRAKAGDVQAAKLLLDRLAPLPKGRPVTFPMPVDMAAASPADLLAHVLRAVAQGRLTPGEAGDVAAVVEALHRAKRSAADPDGLPNDGSTVEFTLKLGEPREMPVDAAGRDAPPPNDEASEGEDEAKQSPAATDEPDREAMPDEPAAAPALVLPLQAHSRGFRQWDIVDGTGRVVSGPHTREEADSLIASAAAARRAAR
jgi:hypothetical protein